MLGPAKAFALCWSYPPGKRIGARSASAERAEVALRCRVQGEPALAPLDRPEGVGRRNGYVARLVLLM
jgi:hypothetical protein